MAKVNKNNQVRMQDRSRIKLSRFDAVLVSVPVFLSIGIGGGVLSEISITAGLAAGSMVCMLMLFYALFVSPPVDIQ